jgi:UDP-GlcNAc:undecaprenyl-phosphate GlcNAc-1-phosphate transferase
MTDLTGIAATFACAAAGVLLFTPYVARLAARMGAVDRPDGHRKNHTVPVPRGGGVAVGLAVFAAIPVALYFVGPLDTTSSAWLWRALVPSVVILILIGIVDDFFTLTGIYKLIGQVLAVSVLIAAGAQFDRISIFGVLIPLGDFRIPFTLFFCLGAINAFNLIDGVDALASSSGAIVCATLGIITASQGHVAASIVCFALAGALVGFLRYNVAPAKVYLGDTGSMLIGLIVAAVAIDSSIKQEAAFVLAVPLAICAIPILDAGAALVRRVTTGQSVFAADRGHLHHALLLRGWSVNKTVLIIVGLTTFTCASALVSYFTNNDLFAFAVAIGVILTLAIARVFGHAEAALVAKQSLSLGRKIVSRGARRPTPELESAVQLQGSRKWQTLWLALREAAPTYNLVGLTWQISIPNLHESFFASWKRNDFDIAGDGWRASLPLMLEERAIGKLSIIGGSAGAHAVADMQQLFEFLDSLHGDIARIVLGDDEPGVVEWQSSAEVAQLLN